VATAITDPKFVTAYNLQNILRWTSLFAILGVGAAFVIISGGIDLSIGSVVGLTGCLVPLFLSKGMPVSLSLFLVALVALAIGLAHGLLVTKLKLQPFVVTLCGLLFYRGLIRYITGDQVQGFGTDYRGLRSVATGSLPSGVAGFEIPAPFIVLVVITAVAAVLLNRTVFGRYLQAVGRNEQAARYSGIPTDRVVIAAYVLCSLLAGLGGVLFAFDVNSVQPSGHGSFYELYAIAAAVLGGCSLRGGEGSIIGVVVGAAVLRVLYNAINVLGIPTQLEFAVIGIVILAGVIADELVRRWVAKRRLARQSRAN